MSIEHDYFGIVGGESGSYWSEMVPVGDQEVEVVMRVESEDVSDDALDAAAALVGSIERLEEDVREALVSELTSVTSPTNLYLTHLTEELDPETIESELSRESGDLQIDILRSLHLERVEIRPENARREEAFAELDYSFAADETDARIQATVDVDVEIVEVVFLP